MRAQVRGRIRRTESQWRELVRRFEASNLSQAAFCERESLTVSSLQRWCKLLREADADAFVEIPVPASSSPARSRRWSLDVTLPDGIVLRFQG